MHWSISLVWVPVIAIWLWAGIRVHRYLNWQIAKDREDHARLKERQRTLEAEYAAQKAERDRLIGRMREAMGGMLVSMGADDDGPKGAN